tara:strand:+ start:1262 stop:2173 length:912 start_codon:yes stop_codon:yes gene_type:complete
MKILFIDKTHSYLKDELEKLNYKCDTCYKLSKVEIEQKIHKYHGIILRSRIKIDKQLINKAINLKFIARAGSGLENIDIKYAEEKNIKCYNAAEGNRQAVAEHALGMILSLFNNLNIANQEVRSGIWNREKNRGIEISGKTIGIIGYGNNGSALANLLKGFKVNILTYDKYLKSYKYSSRMQDIFEKADILSLHIPLTEETHYLIDNTYINKFKKPIYIINTARGKCIKTSDLIKNLKSGKVRGACLDVLENENTSFEKIEKKTHFNYLTQNKNIILSPHIAGWTNESKRKIAEILLKKIKNK